MSPHIYAFGSVCRGEADAGSDLDLLACVSQSSENFDPQKYSIYSHARLAELWKEGNPFAWHLHLESRLLFSTDGSDFLSDLGIPVEYSKVEKDCAKFYALFSESYRSLNDSTNSATFHLSCMFLAMRNFATCYSFTRGRPIFSRLSPILIDKKLPIENCIFNLFVRARILSTRGFGDLLSQDEINRAKSVCGEALDWMDSLISDGAR